MAATSSAAARLLAAALLLALAACGPAAEERPLRVEALEGAAAPLVAEARRAGLTALDGAGQVVPGLAQSWRVSNDGLSLLFRLRDAPGAPTARDAARALDAARRDRRHPFHGLLGGIDGVGAPADGVVELRLATPQPELLELLARPELAIPAPGGGAAGAYAVADGAAGVTLLRRRAAAVAAPPLAAVEVRPADAADGIRRFVRGEADLVLGGRLDGLADARTSPAAGALRVAPARGALLLLAGRDAPDDPRIAAALSLALDRVALGPAIHAGYAAPPLYGLTPPGLPAFPAAEPAWAAEPLLLRQQRARDLLAAAGVAPAAPLTITVALPEREASRPLADRLATDWGAIGVRLVVERRSPAGHAALLRRGRFQYALALREAPAASPLALLLPLRCGAAPGPCARDADAAIAAAWRAPGIAERAAAYAEAERRLLDAGAAIPLVQPLGWALVGPDVAGWQDNAAHAHPLARLDRLPERRLFK